MLCLVGCLRYPVVSVSDLAEGTVSFYQAASASAAGGFCGTFRSILFSSSLSSSSHNVISNFFIIF